MRLIVPSFLLISILAGAAPAAAEGELDPSFGWPIPWGSISDPVPSGLRQSMLLSADAKPYVASVDESSGEIYVARFQASPIVGLDRSFGNNGIASPGIPHEPGSGLDLALQADGKALLAGVQGVARRAFVARFDATGASSSPRCTRL